MKARKIIKRNHQCLENYYFVTSGKIQIGDMVRCKKYLSSGFNPWEKAASLINSNIKELIVWQCCRKINT